MPLEAVVLLNDLVSPVLDQRGPIHVAPKFKMTPWARETLELMLTRFVSRLANKPVTLKLARTRERRFPMTVRLEDNSTPFPDIVPDADIRLALELCQWARTAADELAKPCRGTDSDKQRRNAYAEAVRRAWAATHDATKPEDIRVFVMRAIEQRAKFYRLDDLPPKGPERTAAEKARLTSLVGLVMQHLRKVIPDQAKELTEEHVGNAIRAYGRRGKRGGPRKGQHAWGTALREVLEVLGLATDLEPDSLMKSVRRAEKRKR